MFGFFKKPKPSRTGPEMVAALCQYGALVERSDGVVLDVSLLPFPKEEMGATIKAAWLSSNDTNVRQALECLYAGLATFQEGVGPKPIQIALTQDASPEEAIAILGPALPWLTKSTEEMRTLAADFAKFKQANGGS